MSIDLSQSWQVLEDLMPESVNVRIEKIFDERGIRTLKDLVVHHINGNHYDDRPENRLIVTRAEHASIHHRGKIMSEETKRKLRIQRIGRPLSLEHRAKLSAAKLGKKLPQRTPEHSARISAGLYRAWERRRANA